MILAPANFFPLCGLYYKPFYIINLKTSGFITDGHFHPSLMFAINALWGLHSKGMLLALPGCIRLERK